MIDSVPSKIYIRLLPWRFCHSSNLFLKINYGTLRNPQRDTAVDLEPQDAWSGSEMPFDSAGSHPEMLSQLRWPPVLLDDQRVTLNRSPCFHFVPLLLIPSLF